MANAILIYVHEDPAGRPGKPLVVGKLKAEGRGAPVATTRPYGDPDRLIDDLATWVAPAILATIEVDTDIEVDDIWSTFDHLEATDRLRAAARA